MITCAGVVGEVARLPSFLTMTLSSCCVERTTVWMRCGVPSALYSTVTWLLASGRSELQLAAAGAARRGSRPGDGPGRSAAASGCAFRRRRSRTSCPGRRRRRRPRPWRCAATGRAGGNRPGRCRPRSRCSDRRSRSRGSCRGRAVDGRRGDRSALVVISPATTARSVVTSVSQATRLVGSAARQWSRMASLIWSATLSGWPIETDSLVNRYRSALTSDVLVLGKEVAPPWPPVRGIIGQGGRMWQSQRRSGDAPAWLRGDLGGRAPCPRRSCSSTPSA